MAKLFFFPAFTRPYRMLLAFSGFVLVVSVALGYGTWAADAALARQATDQVMARFEIMAGLNWWGQFLVILFNNLKVIVLAIISGAFIPLLPFLVGLLSNGVFLGLLAGYYEYEKGVANSTFFLNLLSHGLFEIPAVLLAVTVGALWGVRNWRSFFRGEKAWSSWGDHAKASLAFVPLILVLLFIAALVEVLVTPLLGNLPSFV
ncbi:MAG: stage II sporulation protein M [Firmicutes bacterium]|nr:stage II sporulation protein M [Bacillota bacterium]